MIRKQFTLTTELQNGGFELSLPAETGILLGGRPMRREKPRNERGWGFIPLSGDRLLIRKTALAQDLSVGFEPAAKEAVVCGLECTGLTGLELEAAPAGVTVLAESFGEAQDASANRLAELQKAREAQLREIAGLEKKLADERRAYEERLSAGMAVLEKEFAEREARQREALRTREERLSETRKETERELAKTERELDDVKKQLLERRADLRRLLGEYNDGRVGPLSRDLVELDVASARRIAEDIAAELSETEQAARLLGATSVDAALTEARSAIDSGLRALEDIIHLREEADGELKKRICMGRAELTPEEVKHE